MTTVENHLIELLPPRDRQRLLDACQPVPLRAAQRLSEAGQAPPHVYFPLRGCVSVAGPDAGSPGPALGLVGREGMLGAELALGVATSPWLATVQQPGLAWRLGTSAFRRELARSPALRRTLGRYLYVLLTQLTSVAACQRQHRVGPRVARCLLMSQDRAHADTFHATHAGLALTLGVRRVGITAAAGELQRRGLIAYHRGALTVIDRAGLETAACGCYAGDRRAYDAWLS